MHTPFVLIKLLASSIMLVCCTQYLRAQADELSPDFFKQQAIEFNEWLVAKGMHQVLRVDSLQCTTDAIHLYLGSRYNDTYTRLANDSLNDAWLLLRNYYGTGRGFSLEERLLNELSFLAETSRANTQITVLGRNAALFKVHFAFEGDSLVVAETIARPRAGGQVDIRFHELDKSLRGKSATLSNATLADVRRAIGQYLNDYYSARGTRVRYKAHVEVQREYYNELIYEVSLLDHEILYDIGYFEYIRIRVKVQQNGSDVEVHYELQGKYGSGILRPPRKNDYKSMENKYPEYVRAYQEKLENSLRNFLVSGW